MWIKYFQGGEKMKKAIYKITNKVNNKIYIGQSKNPEMRWEAHCQKKERYESLIHKAIIHYGRENFTFEILGWFEDYNEKEKYYIQLYRSLTPYGYNIMTGGEVPPVHYGEENPAAKINNETAELIKKDLMNWSIPRKQIVKKYHVTHDIVRHINEGDSWRDCNLTYPLRPQEKELDKLKVEKVIELLTTTDLSQKEIGRRVGWNRSAVTMINTGKNHYNPDLTYPLREGRHYNK